ncbi:RHS repeat-associated core domain-containing protein [Marinobacterium sp. BA1]|uniref:RHS repeat-associated core domain-containing protein n=1 Tax=Marinobacterium sp. BA1 TaxID=3138931 RepID=UPI0032E60364
MTTTLANSITHAPFGPVSGLTYGNGLTLTNTYDSQYRLTDTQVGQLLDRNYSFNGNDDITGINQEVTGQLVFDYDPLRRLEYAQTPSTILSWTYDSNGNRLSETAGQSVDTYYVDSWSNRLLEISGSTQSIYTYDANGNVLSKGGLNFSYDRYNSLTSVSGTVSATYTYNAHRQRTSKTVNGQTTYYLYNQSGQLLAELDHSGQTKVEYVWLGTQPLAVIHSGPASAVVYYIHTDHLNTPQVVSDNQGTVVWRADYDAFGKASVASGSILTFNLRFPGQYFDSETGLHYNYYRDYDPSTGRYLQSDPIGLRGGLNTYFYVGGNPLNYYDPDGLRWRKKLAEWLIVIAEGLSDDDPGFPDSGRKIPDPVDEKGKTEQPYEPRPKPNDPDKKKKGNKVPGLCLSVFDCGIKNSCALGEAPQNVCDLFDYPTPYDLPDC